MTFKIYRKAFSGIALATSVLLTALVGGASAATGTRVNGLTGHDLLKGGLSAAPAADLLNEGLSVAQHHVAPAQLTPGFSRATRFSSEGLTVSAPKHAEAMADAVIADDMLAVNKADDTKVPTFVDTTVAQSEVIAQADVETEVAQDVGDTFAPLSDDEIRQLLLIDSNSALDLPRAIPSSSFLTPSAYGADWGDAFVGLAGASAGNIADIDGSVSVGFGVGDAVDNVGVEVSVGIISLDGVADDGIVGFKLHKVFPEANNLGLALGWSNPVKWGLAEQEEDTFYGVVTQRYDLEPGEPNPLPLTVSLGVGTGTFRSTGAIAAGTNDPNFFGSLGVRVLPELSVVSSWTGSGLGMAVSAAPFEFPLIFTAGFSDVTDNTAEGPRFNGGMGYSFSFR